MKTLIWLFYEGNDTGPSLNQEFLLDYLRPGFTQSLKQSADQVNLMYEQAGNIDDLSPEPPHRPPLAETLWESERKLRYEIRRLLAPTVSFLKSFRPAQIAFDVDLYRRILGEGRRVALERGAERFIVGYLPAWERFMWKPRRHASVIEFDKVRDTVSASAAMTGFEFVDVSEAFYATPDPIALFPFRGNGHYNELGYAVAGQAILAGLAARAKSE